MFAWTLTRPTLIDLFLIALSSNFALIGFIAFHGTVSSEANYIAMESPLLVDSLISAKEAHTLTNIKNIVFVDARSQKDYSSGHIEGAISINRSNVNKGVLDNLDELSKAQQIIVYCGSTSCGEAYLLSRDLKSLGLERCRVLKEGYSGWK